MEKLFQMKHLKKYYPIGVKRERGKPEEVINLKAVDDITFNIFKGENLGVVGESGCGKSTLGRCILKLIEPTEGDIIFRDESIIRKNKKQMVALRKDMQMVFQNPYSSFNPKQTLKKALMDVAKFYGMKDEEAKKKIYELLQYVNLDPSLLSRRSGELSGGQLQRLAIVRALMDFQCRKACSCLKRIPGKIMKRTARNILMILKKYRNAWQHPLIQTDLNVPLQ